MTKTALTAAIEILKVAYQGDHGGVMSSRHAHSARVLIPVITEISLDEIADAQPESADVASRKVYREVERWDVITKVEQILPMRAELARRAT